MLCTHMDYPRFQLPFRLRLWSNAQNAPRICRHRKRSSFTEIRPQPFHDDVANQNDLPANQPAKSKNRGKIHQKRPSMGKFRQVRKFLGFPHWLGNCLHCIFLFLCDGVVAVDSASCGLHDGTDSRRNHQLVRTHLRICEFQSLRHLKKPLSLRLVNDGRRLPQQSPQTWRKSQFRWRKMARNRCNLLHHDSFG